LAGKARGGIEEKILATSDERDPSAEFDQAPGDREADAHRPSSYERVLPGEVPGFSPHNRLLVVAT
jgi:hypothetical protein